MLSDVKKIEQDIQSLHTGHVISCTWPMYTDNAPEIPDARSMHGFIASCLHALAAMTKQAEPLA